MPQSWHPQLARRRTRPTQEVGRPGSGRGRTALVGLLLAVVVASGAFSASAATAGRDSARRWVAAWEGSPTVGGTIPAPIFNCPSDVGLKDQTVRNVVFLSAGGDRVRVRLTNAFGSEPLRVGAASVAISAGGADLVGGSRRTLQFSGAPSVSIAAGGEVLSDPVRLTVRPLETLAVSVYLPDATGPATQHFFATQTNFVGPGNQALSPGGGGFDQQITCWMFASGVDVQASPRFAGTVVALGDSITDGFGSTTNANLRYPDQLARRMNARSGPKLSVANAGLGGNTIFRNRPDFAGIFGVTAPARLDRDVLTATAVTDVILLEGINDIGKNGSKANELIGADQQIIGLTHARGVKIYGATLTPFGGSNPGFGGEYGTAEGEAQRQALNQWIRTSGAFDGVFDFDKAIRDPQDPSRMLPAFDSGDHLHPNDAGYAAMAQVVDLQALVRR